MLQSTPGCLCVCLSVCLCVCLCHLYSPNEWTDFDETFHKSFSMNLLNTFFSDFEKELIVDFNPDSDICHKPVHVSEKEVEVVDDFIYLGTTIDKKLSFKANAERVFKKANQRLHLLRKLRSFGVSNKVLQTVYKSLVQSILTFNVSVWYNILNQKDKVMLSRIVNTASKIVGIPQAPLNELHCVSVLRKASKIVNDPSHPLFPSFEVLPSGRRFRAPRWRKVLFKRSFVPSAVSILNS